MFARFFAHLYLCFQLYVTKTVSSFFFIIYIDTESIHIHIIINTTLEKYNVIKKLIVFYILRE